MFRYEYKVVQLPERCHAVRDEAKGTDPVSFTVEAVLNDLGVSGWEYVRTDRVTLRRPRFFGSRSVSRNLMVFRRYPVTRLDRTPEEQPVPEEEAAPAVREASVLEQIEQVLNRQIRRADLVDSVKAGGRRVSPVGGRAPA